MAWTVFFDKLWKVKGHIVGESLVDLLEADLRERFGAERDPEKCRMDEQVYFEPGGYGMYHLKQPKMCFEVQGKQLELDCVKVFELLSELTLAKRRHFADGTGYYKLHSRFNCLVLSVAEREELLFVLRGKEAEATALAETFFEEAEHTWQKMKAEYEADGKQFPIIRLKDLEKDKPPIN